MFRLGHSKHLSGAYFLALSFRQIGFCQIVFHSSLRMLPSGDEVALAGNDGAVGFNGHVYSASTATLNSQLKLKRVYFAVLRGRVPCELHAQLPCLVSYSSENRLQRGFLQRKVLSNFRSFSRVD